ncbi:MAG: iron-containing alcohol dehydrogenase [Deltaproteobacteria bacterium]|nr:iron-containing alcohol dehydrogenase [Deltaproteobacteria bacterium]
MLVHSDFYAPVKIIAGEGAMDNIAVELSSLDSCKPLVIAPSGTATIIRDLVCAFGETGMEIGVFSHVTGKPTLADVKNIHEIYTSRGFDGIIAVGGGKVVHLAKIANIAASSSPEILRQFLADEKIPLPQLNPLVILSGLIIDGYECSKYAIFSDKRYESPSLIPKMVIVDKYALSGVFSPEVALSSALVMICALDDYLTEKHSFFSRAYTNSLFGLLIAAVDKARKPGKWKLPLANSLSLTGFLLSNNGGGWGYQLAQALAAKKEKSTGECACALLPHLLELAFERCGEEMGRMLMPILDVDSVDEVKAVLLATYHKIAQEAGVEGINLSINNSEGEEMIASIMLEGSAKADCSRLMVRLSS